MAEYEQHNQLDYRLGGDTIDDFAQKYMAETTRIFRFLNDLKQNKINGTEYTEPSPGQLNVEDGKIYIRNEANDKWLLLGRLDENFGFKPADASFLTDADIATEANQPGKVYKTDENGILPVSIGGNAAKLAGINVNTDIIEDGQVLTYRAATNSWHNEPKGVIGSGKALNLYDGKTLLCSYAGDTSQDFDLGITANKKFAEDTAKDNADYVRSVVNNKADKLEVTTKISTHNTAANAHSNGLENPLRMWAAGTTYAVNNIVIQDKKIWMCITPNSDAEFDKAKWQNIGGGGGRNLGEILWLSAEDAEGIEGILKADHAEVSRTMYPDLNALYASQGYPWGDGDGTTTFNLPNLIGKFPEGAAVAGGYHEAGLPNIMGKTGLGGEGLVSLSSALLIPYVVVFTEQTTDSALIDVTQMAQEVANKANRDLSNLSEAGRKKLGVTVVDSYRDNDGNWYRVYSDGWVEQGGYVTNNGQGSTAGENNTVSLLKPFIDTSYTVLQGENIIYDSRYAVYRTVNNKTTESFGFVKTNMNLGKEKWYACGQGANE